MGVDFQDHSLAKNKKSVCDVSGFWCVLFNIYFKSMHYCHCDCCKSASMNCNCPRFSFCFVLFLQPCFYGNTIYLSHAW
jgi:hypothetical protein